MVVPVVSWPAKSWVMVFFFCQRVFECPFPLFFFTFLLCPRLKKKKKKTRTWVRIWSRSSPRVALSPVSGSTAESISASAFLPLFVLFLLFSAAAEEEEEDAGGEATEEEEGLEEEEEEEEAFFTALSIRPSILSRTRCLACRARPKAENLPRL